MANIRDYAMAQTKSWQWWRKVLFSFQSKVLLWYFVLMSIYAFIFIVAIRQILFERLHKRVDRSLIQKLQEFCRLTAGNNPYTGQTFGNDIGAMFYLFLSRKVPD